MKTIISDGHRHIFKLVPKVQTGCLQMTLIHREKVLLYRLCLHIVLATAVGLHFASSYTLWPLMWQILWCHCYKPVSSHPHKRVAATEIPQTASHESNYVMSTLSHSPLFQCFSGLCLALALLTPPALSSGGNVPDSVVLCPKMDPPGLGVGVSADPSVWVLSSRAFSATPFSVAGQSVVAGVSEVTAEVTDEEVTGRGAELMVVLGFAQSRLHHWARTGEQKRRTSARERWRAPILLPRVAWAHRRGDPERSTSQTGKSPAMKWCTWVF